MLKVGDRVKYVETGHSLFTKVGTIIYIDRVSQPEYGVRFDEEFPGGHNLSIELFDPKCEFGHGWWCYEHELEIIESSVAHTAEELYKVWGDDV